MSSGASDAFYGSSGQVYERIRDARVEFPEDLSPDLVEVLRGGCMHATHRPHALASCWLWVPLETGCCDRAGIFTVNVAHRWTLKQIRESKWLQGRVPSVSRSLPLATPQADLTHRRRSWTRIHPSARCRWHNSHRCVVRGL
jgi:hypothetical protein